ncbi:DUF418 domain-containing protein [Asticcacaulis sp. EMRT-3]|uniref:DUF418 domain-containing protein n=1 Tax=Asticcacaulis sp. EMRT-3 TaxID=3040349 RepID=UPI0024AF39FE|nr:DUF418 domain-containing protein [Asticcacaulis sp. EMRT-3]MDI7776050.1 DUF418 domain-containing protein [Asticcacaulis sp. EMRT-3]
MKARIAALDHIRGLSILGILLVNAIAFAQPFEVYSLPGLSPLPLTQADRFVWWLSETFFENKFITAFTLLFGVSMFLVGRDHPPGRPVYDTPLFRRLGWLAVFGLIHGALIWHGDILLAYAVTGAFFWRWRAASPKILLGFGLFLFIIGNLLIVGPLLLTAQGSAGDPQAILAMVGRMQGGFWRSLGGNFTTWADSEASELISYLPLTLGLMMVGLGLFKSGWLRGEGRMIGYVAAIVAAVPCLALIGWQAYLAEVQDFPFPQTLGLYDLANRFLCLPVTLGYMAVLIVMGRTRLGAWLLHPLACCGRMAFSNYLMQSLIMTGIFYGGRSLFWQGGLFGTMNHAALVPIVIAIWIGQLVVSTLWLRFFRYGPFEWGWRCLTYRQVLAITR